VAVATELHFRRAAGRLHIAAPTLSELIRRLKRELGTPLLTRTTRRVALTSAGAELLSRSKVILDGVAAAQAAVHRVAGGEASTVRLGVTPPAAPVLAPHLINLFASQAPHVTVDLQRMWLPKLLDLSLLAASMWPLPAARSRNRPGSPPRCSAPSRSWSACGQGTAWRAATRSRYRSSPTRSSAPPWRHCSPPGP
jgi:DNA-binding transcriptional LysR family regulator